MTPEALEAIGKVLPWAVPILPLIPFIPKLIKAYNAKVKQIAEDALAEEREERESCDKRVQEAREEAMAQMKADADNREAIIREKLAAQDLRIENLVTTQDAMRATMNATRAGIYRVLLAVAAAKVDPSKLDGIIDDLRVIAEGL